MTSFDAGLSLADRFRRHAQGLSSPLYAELMRAMADDWEMGGPVRKVCAGWEDAPSGTVVQLRLLAGLYRVVLRGEAPELTAFYRSLGGQAAPDDVWPVARTVIAAHVDELRAALQLAPQTNEPGRCAALAVGLLDALWRSGLRRVRLLELGASAGLNLLVDRIRVEGGGWATGPASSRLVLAGAVVGDVEPVDYAVVERRGCDLSPVDATTDAGRMLLTSFVWPDHAHRFERLRAALDIAGRTPVQVERAGAGEWLEAVLDEPVADDVLTVVWHSITRLYWPREEVRRVQAAVWDAASRLPALAHVTMEYPDAASLGPVLEVRVWRDGTPDGRRSPLGPVGDHGLPVELAPGVRVGPD